MLNTGGERVVADQQHVDINPTGIFLRLQFAGNLRRRRLRKIDAGDEVGACFAISFESVLGELQIAGRVDDVQRHRRRRQLRAGGGRCCRRSSHAGEHAAPHGSDACHVSPIENTDPSQLQAIDAVGGSRLLAVRFGILPQIIPVLLAQTLYSFESNIRSAAILGVVGAGGIGLQIAECIKVRFWDEVSFIIILILVTVTLIDMISSRVRRRLVA